MSLQAAAAFNYPLFSCANSAHSSANHSLRARARAHARVERRIGPLWTTEEKFPECYSTVGLACWPWTQLHSFNVNTPNLLNLLYVYICVTRIGYLSWLTSFRSTD